MGMTQREVAKKMGLSRSMVFKIEQAALVKLRKRLRAIGITREDIGVTREGHMINYWPRGASPSGKIAPDL